MLNINARPRFERAIFKGTDSEFRATFALMPKSEMDALDLTTADGTTTFLRRVVVDLDDLAAGDEPIGFSPSVLERVIDLPDCRRALCDAYFEGVGQARLGNSNGPRASGRPAD